MFDRYYVRRSLRLPDNLDPDYRPQQAIKSSKFINKSSDKLAVVFPGWHNSPDEFPINRLIKRLVKDGWAVLAYDFNAQILEPEDKLVVESFRYIADSVVADLKRLSKNYKRVNLIGISLGTVSWAMVADRFKEFTDATLIVGGDDLAMDMWHGIRTQNYRRAFQKMHIGIRNLDKEWYGIAPVNHLKNFVNKPVTIYLSLNDEVIRSKYQKKMAERLAEAGAITRVKKYRTGHGLTLARACIFG